MKKSIKSDRTLLLTSILLFFMLAAGIVSGTIGFISGHAALKGVTQPDIRPNNGNNSNNGKNAATRGLELLKEAEILGNVKKQMGVEDPKLDSKQAADAKKQAEAFEKAVKNDPKAGMPVGTLPISIEDQGIILTVNSAKPQGNLVKLDIALRNTGSQPVSFNGSSFVVNTDKNQTVSASTSGLPGKLPATKGESKVTVTIPKSSLDKVKSITLQLTDGDKKLQLEASGVPIGK
jgi:hypothetical protein